MLLPLLVFLLFSITNLLVISHLRRWIICTRRFEQVIDGFGNVAMDSGSRSIRQAFGVDLHQRQDYQL